VCGAQWAGKKAEGTVHWRGYGGGTTHQRRKLQQEKKVKRRYGKRRGEGWKEGSWGPRGRERSSCDVAREVSTVKKKPRHEKNAGGRNVRVEGEYLKEKKKKETEIPGQRTILRH